MEDIIKRIVILLFGLFLCAVGIVLIINAEVGVAPWDVFHQGISKLTGITLGQASIYSGVIIVILDVILGQKIGWGTILNMLLIGTFIDLLMLNNLLPIFSGLPLRYLSLVLGIIIQGFGVYFYLSVALGAGPRDGLMVALTRKTGKSVRVIKTIMEVIVVSLGFILGGNLGIGTLIMALFTGVIWQEIFKLVNCQVDEIEHRFIDEDIKYLKKQFLKI